MSSKSLNVRLTAVFSITFILFTLAMFSASSYFLGSALKQEEDARIQRLALKFWALSQAYGNELLTEEVFRSEYLEDGQSLVRLADRSGATLLWYFPDHFSEFDLEALERQISGTGADPRLPPEELTLAADHRRLRIVSIELPDGRLLQIGLETTNRLSTLRQFRVVFPLIALPFLALSLIGGLAFSRNSLRPIGSLIRTTRRIIETGKMDARIPVSGSGDELDELVELFNRMIGRIDGLISGMRNTLDNAAHDLRTPITRLRGRAEAALRDARGTPDTAGGDGTGGRAEPEAADRTAPIAAAPDPERYSAALHALGECVEEASRIQTMLGILMDISEAETGHMKLSLARVELSELLADIAELYAYAAEDRSLSLETRIGPGLSVTADADRLRQVAANLLDNAVKYTPPGGRITISAEREGGQSAGSGPEDGGSDRKPEETGARRGGIIRITVRDTGIGIPAGEQRLIWNRLYRCDASRSEPGLGLGLSLVKAVVEAHRGTVEVSSEPGKGSAFTIRLPEAPGA